MESMNETVKYNTCKRGTQNQHILHARVQQ